MKRPSIAIVGAGLAGLSAAWHLRERGYEVRVFERSTRAGGVIDTAAVDGFRFECGPTTVPAAAPTLQWLIERSGMSSRRLTSRGRAKRRYVWHRGALHELPTGPGTLVRSRLLSWRGKLLLLGEPLVSAATAPADETLAGFFARRLGPETVDAFARPLAHGVYAGRPEELGVEAFARLGEWERRHGGLLRGLLAERRRAAAGGQPTTRELISFPGGMRDLADRLAERLDAPLALGAEVTAIAPCDGDRSGWRLEYRAAADGRSDTATATTSVDGVVLATPARAAAELIRPLSAAAAATLGEIPHAAVAVVGLGYARAAIAHPLDGFGLLVAEHDPRRIDEWVLGILFCSSIFADRAPTGAVNLTVMLGGRRAPNVVSHDDDEILRLAHRACRELLGASAPPMAHSIARWPYAIPQYVPGHERRLRGAAEQVAQLGAIRLAGSYLDGVGVEPTALSGATAADALATLLG